MLAIDLNADVGESFGAWRMGADADAVVDASLRVRNIRGLRVADASVMPSITAGATHAPSIMIGGRVAEMIVATGQQGGGSR